MALSAIQVILVSSHVSLQLSLSKNSWKYEFESIEDFLLRKKGVDISTYFQLTK